MNMFTTAKPLGNSSSLSPHFLWFLRKDWDWLMSLKVLPVVLQRSARALSGSLKSESPLPWRMALLTKEPHRRATVIPVTWEQLITVIIFTSASITVFRAFLIAISSDASAYTCILNHFCGLEDYLLPDSSWCWRWGMWSHPLLSRKGHAIKEISFGLPVTLFIFLLSEQQSRVERKRAKWF